MNDMLSSFLAFNQNALSNFAYVLTTNICFFLIIAGVIGSIILMMKEEVDTAIKEDQDIL